ncbi:CBS domain-containing protein [Streptomyces sp. NPDC056222]|uniref:CBS domain-containing protein n=1 Tax=Streptomyces sp. NPDC056222 TaxID=3345749 RepID=UPI0035D8909F
MKRLTAGGPMTDGVVSTVPAAPFRDVAKLLAEHDISGLPVVDGRGHGPARWRGGRTCPGRRGDGDGRVRPRSRARMLIGLVEQVDGVVAVVDQLSVAEHDTHFPPSPSRTGHDITW